MSIGSKVTQDEEEKLQLECVWVIVYEKELPLEIFQNKCLYPESIMPAFQRPTHMPANCLSFSMVTLCVWSGSREQCLTSNIFSILRTALGFLGFQLLFAESGMIFTLVSFFPSSLNIMVCKETTHHGLL